MRLNVQLWAEKDGYRMCVCVCAIQKHKALGTTILKHATDSGKTFLITECVYIFLRVSWLMVTLRDWANSTQHN